MLQCYYKSDATLNMLFTTLNILSTVNLKQAASSLLYFCPVTISRSPLLFIVLLSRPHPASDIIPLSPTFLAAAVRGNQRSNNDAFTGSSTDSYIRDVKERCFFHPNSH